MIIFLFLLAIGFSGIGEPASAQEGSDDPESEKAPTDGEPIAEELTPEAKSLHAIRNLLISIAKVQSEIESLRESLPSAGSDDERDSISAAVQEKTLQFERLTDDLGAVATGIDPEDYELDPTLANDLSAELEEFLRPLVGQLKKMTAKPREMEDLRSKLSHHAEQIGKAKEAIGHLNVLLVSAREEATRDTLQTLRTLWTERLKAAESDLDVVQFKFGETQRKQSSVFVSAKEAIASFFRTRGRNFLTALVAFLGVWLGIRFLFRLLTRLSPFHKKRGKRNFYVRLAGICVEGLAIFAGIFSVLIVLYSAADWMLLGLFLILLAGLAWTGRRALPLFYEQMKLMLNLGSVREGERVVVDGIPWIVKRINIYTDLVNPMLLGGHLRVPILKLVSLHSRPYESKEAWFPTAVGNWLELSDGTFGRLIRQPPHWVTLVELGGARKGYRTMEFLSLAPRTLSNNFRVRSTFGIDYRHQTIATTEVPAILLKRLEKDLTEFVEPDEIIHVDVQFKEAGSSSLDYVIFADFAGSAAPKRNGLEYGLQRICVDVCNEQGWVIPFTQVTLHQAASVEPEVAATIAD